MRRALIAALAVSVAATAGSAAAGTANPEEQLADKYAPLVAGQRIRNPSAAAPDLARVVTAWPDLPPHVRAAVLALVGTAPAAK